MSKGRIGLSLETDVLAILAEYGRAERLGPGAILTGEHRKPTRTEITQTAIREWAARQVVRSNGGAVDCTT